MVRHSSQVWPLEHLGVPPPQWVSFRQSTHSEMESWAQQCSAPQLPQVWPQAESLTQVSQVPVATTQCS